MNFNELLLDILNEKGKSFKDLEDAGVICPRTFYQYKSFTPFLPTILKIANYLQVSLDYLSGRKTVNNFKTYSDDPKFYEKLMEILKSMNISQSKFAKDLKIGRTNFTYWKQDSLPKFNLLIEIANYLNCDIDDLLETL